MSAKFKVMPIKIKLAAGRAVKKVAFAMEAETKPLVPVDTGHLRRSTKVKNVKPMSAEFGSYTDYAWAQHEGHFKHKIGERKFVEKGVNRVKPRIKGIFNREISLIK